MTAVSQKEEEEAVLTTEEQEMVVEIETMMKRVEKERVDEHQEDVKYK